MLFVFACQRDQRGEFVRSTPRLSYLWMSRLTGCGVLLFLCAFSSGCVSLHRKPVGDNVIRARQLSLRGSEALHDGRWHEAEELFKSAIESCPVDERARRGYAETLWQRRSRKEAIDQMEQAVRFSASAPELLVQLGEMYVAEGEVDRALNNAVQAIRVQKHLASAWALRGDAERIRGNIDIALASYHRALGIQENYPRVQVSVAQIYLTQNRPQRALSTLQAAKGLYLPDQIPQPLLHFEGIALKSLGRYDDAVNTLQLAARRGPPYSDLLYELAHAQYLIGDFSRARITLNHVIHQQSNHLPSLQLLAQLDRSLQPTTAVRRY